MPINTLPSDALLCIVRRVPVKDRLTAALACKPMSAECISLADDGRKVGHPRWM